MNIPFLYIWIHLPTKKWYIGSRTAKNCHPLDGYICSSNVVKELILLHSDEWKRYILATGNSKEIVQLEANLLNKINAKTRLDSFNMHNGDGKFTFLNRSHSLATKQKLSQIGSNISEEKRKKLSEEKKNRIILENTKLKMSKAKLGKNRTPFTSEHKEKLSKAHSQRQRSPHSLETKLKMSDTRKGRIVSEETKKKISKTMQNKAQLKRCSLLTAMLQ